MLKKYLYISLGLICVVFGYVGIMLPGIPTTPFLLLSVWFFSRSSKKFEDWIINHKIFGKFISDWRNHRGISTKPKIYAVILIQITFLSSIYYAFPLSIDIIFFIFSIILCLYIISRPIPPK
tara:strand:+ start:777 stop:1142 length:366 start_codon:yes stop_codon:yes gene_type:complete